MIEFVKNDPQEIFKGMITAAEKAAGETLLPGDERYMFLQQMVPVLVGVRAAINDTGNQNLLRYARGEVLDAYGDDRDVQRLPASKASVTLRFSIAVALGFDVIIPAGTRVTPDGVLNFTVNEQAVITAGATSVDVTATAEYAGNRYNGFLPGQIANIVDPILHVSTVTNTNISSGGTDIEDDDSYRERIRLSLEMIPTTGCADGYIGWAKTVSSNIADVAVSADTQGNVYLHVLTKDAEPPSDTLLKQVADVVSAKKRRPLTDHVTVQGAVQKSYDITLTYYISKANSAEEVKIQNRIERAAAAYRQEMQSHLGGYINPDTLRGDLYAAGAYRIDITAPVFTALAENEVAVCANLTLTYGGLL